MIRRASLAILVAAALSIALPLAALADPLEPFIERSAQANFTGQQVVSCDTPDGARTVAVEVAQVDGVTIAHDAVGGSAQVRVAGGSFSVVTDDGIVGTSAALSTAVPPGSYTVSQVESVRVLGREAQRVSVVDSDGVLRATMSFDTATGAMLAARIRNADQSVYCVVRMVDFSENVSRDAAAELPAGAMRTLEAVETPTDERLPTQLAGFARLQTYEWDRGGLISYYSDGLFSFALLATDRPLVLDDASARMAQVDGQDYVRWFGAGQTIYVWETAAGGLAMYGDLPLDMQFEVLDQLPAPERYGVLTRWWRNLFG